jgi:RTX calcium-binding nonapeptide repeat (4 copies)/Beta-propeller repeat
MLGATKTAIKGVERERGPAGRVGPETCRAGAASLLTFQENAMKSLLNKRFGRMLSPKRRPETRRARPQLEALEDRAVPAILFHQGVSVTLTNSYPGQAPGPVLSNPLVELVFWGSQWNTGSNPTLRTNMTNAVTDIIQSVYILKLGQYGVGTGELAGTPITITNSSPGTNFTDPNVRTMLQNNVGGSIPYHSNWLYMVIVQPGSTDPTEGLGGNHAVQSTGSGNVYYGWTRNLGGASPMDDLTNLFSHEYVEAVTDPAGTAYQVSPRNQKSWNEICDNEAQNYSFRVDNYLVQSYFSAEDDAFAVPNGSINNFLVSSTGVLTLQNPGNTSTIEVSRGSNGGVYAAINGSTAQFDPGAISGITVNGADGDQILVDQTVIPITINDAPNVNIGAGFAYLVQAGVTIKSPNVKTALTLDDSADKGQATIDVRPSSLQLSENDNPLPAIQFDQGRLSSLTLEGGPGSPQFNLASGAGTPLEQLPQNITVSGGGGESMLWVFGDNSADGAYTVSGQSVAAFRNVIVNRVLHRQLTNEISYSGMGKVIVSGNNTGSSFLVKSTLATTPVALFGGLGQDTFQVGTAADSLDSVLGQVTIIGFGGGDQLSIDDSASIVGLNPVGFTVTPTEVIRQQTVRNRLGLPVTITTTVAYVGIAGVNIIGGPAAPDVLVKGTAAGTPLTVSAATYGGFFQVGDATDSLASLLAPVTLTGNNTTSSLVLGNAAGATWRVTGDNSGSVGPVAFSGTPNLVGAGPNIFDLSPAGQALTIHGGGAGNWLDYTAFPAGSPVTVNLATDSATNVGGGAAGAVTNIQNVWGGAGANSLTGNAQGNVFVGGGNTGVITGGSGRSVLVGGGTDQLAGHSDSDLLIAGALGSALNEATLPLVLQEWQRTDIGYGKRITDLEYGGGQHGSTVLTWGTTVIGDNGGATLTGGPGQNWFFANLHTGIKDTITNLVSGEQVNNGDFGAAFSIGATTNTVNGGSGNAITTDPAGNVYFGGWFSGTTKVGTDSFTTSDQSSGVVAKYTPSHALAWADAFIGSGGSDFNEVVAVATDAAGNVYVDDTFSGRLTVGSFTLTSSSQGQDSFLAKLNSAGVVQWVRQISSPTILFVFNSSVAVDASGDSYVSGDFQKTLTIGSTTLTAEGASFDGFFAKLDPSGNVLFAKNLGGTGESSVDSIAVTGTGTILLGGGFNGTVTFGSSTFTAVGDDGFVSKLNNSGQFIWTQPIVDAKASPFGADAAAVVTDTSGDVYVSGPFGGSATFGAITLPGGPGKSDVFVAKLNSAGTFQWARQMGNSGDDETYSLAIDAVGNLYTAGYYQGTATFGSTTLTASADFDSFVAKLNSAGSVVWADDMGGPGNASATSVAADGAGDIYSTGDYGYDFGTSALAADFDAGPATYGLTSQDTAGSAYVSEVTQPGAVTFTGLTGLASASYKLRLNAGDIQLVDAASGQVLLSKVLADTTSITITAASGVNTTLAIDFSGGAYTVPVTFKGSTGDNTLVGPNVNSAWTITGSDAGTVGNIAFSGVGNLVGGTAIDVFKMMPQGSEASINGGGGGDWLSYSAYSTGVSVDLTTGKATGISGSVSNIENVMGGSGNDQLMGNSQGNILDGNGGNDVLIAGSGASVLIGGGAGSVTFDGGAGQDIMIPGTTVYDNNFAALDAILSEWQRTDLNYTQRIHDLEVGGGLNGSNILIFNQTVLDDGGAPDTMTGGTGMDWFFQFPGDSITNLRAGEQVNNTPPAAANSLGMVGVDTPSNPDRVSYRSAPAGVVPGSKSLGAVSLFIPLTPRHHLDQFFISALEGPN